MSAHKVVCYGEILWDLLPSGAKAGGAPMNVAYHLNKLGMNPAVISRVGNEDLGRKIVKLLQEQGLNTNYIQTDQTQPTGTVNAHLKENHQVEYDIVYPVAWDYITWQNDLEPLLLGADYFVFGSLAARSEVSKKTLFRLLEIAEIKVLDINLRPPHFSRALIEELLSKADILKLNDHEVALIANWYRTSDDIVEQVQLIQDRFALETILVTRGDKGALINHKGILATHSGYKVQVADTVGSGDAFLAGYLSKTAAGSSTEDALTFANALGAFIATQTGACPSYDLAKVNDIMLIKT